MSMHVTGSLAASVFRAAAANLFVLLLLLLFVPAPATGPTSSFCNFDRAVAPCSFGTLDAALAPGSFCNFLPTPALPSLCAGFVPYFSVAQADRKAAPYCDTS